MTDIRSRAAFDSGYSSVIEVIDCHSTGYHALGSQGWLPTLELLHSSAHIAPTCIIDRTASTTWRGANFNAHTKMPPSEGRKLIRVFTEYRYLLGVWCGIAVHGKKYVLNHLPNDAPSWVSNSSPRRLDVPKLAGSFDSGAPLALLLPPLRVPRGRRVCRA
jgi:hypothetical protein